jgi:hypothetical protein
MLPGTGANLLVSVLGRFRTFRGSVAGQVIDRDAEIEATPPPYRRP